MDSASLARFMPKIQVADDGCWMWIAGRTGGGYGNFALGSRGGSKVFVTAHRLAYEHFVGPIPEGLQLDHLCRNRACVNPAHLEPVTNRENSRRGAKGRMVTHCKQGHEFTPENTYWRKEGRRICRECVRIRSIYYNAKSKREKTRQFSPDFREASNERRRAARRALRHETTLPSGLQDQGDQSRPEATK